MTYLVDSNVLLRLSQLRSDLRPAALAAVAALRSQDCDLVFSPQNVLEFWGVATRPEGVNGLGMSPEEADESLQSLEDYFTLLPDDARIHDVWRRLVVEVGVSGRQVHDARLAAVMLVHAVTHILTFNGNDFRRYPGVTVVDPRSFIP